MSETILEVHHLGKSFGSHEILRDIDFVVRPGDVTCSSDHPAPVNLLCLGA